MTKENEQQHKQNIDYSTCSSCIHFEPHKTVANIGWCPMTNRYLAGDSRFCLFYETPNHKTLRICAITRSVDTLAEAMEASETAVIDKLCEQHEILENDQPNPYKHKESVARKKAWLLDIVDVEAGN